MSFTGLIPGCGINASHCCIRGIPCLVSFTIIPGSLNEITCSKKKVMSTDPKQNEHEPRQHLSSYLYIHASIKLTHAIRVPSKTLSTNLMWLHIIRWVIVDPKICTIIEATTLVITLTIRPTWSDPLLIASDVSPTNPGSLPPYLRVSRLPLTTNQKACQEIYVIQLQ